MFDPARRLISSTKGAQSAAAIALALLRRNSRICDEINAYLFALAFGLAVLDGTVCVATSFHPLATPMLDTFGEASPTTVAPSNANDPLAQEACSTYFSCVANW